MLVRLIKGTFAAVAALAAALVSFPPAASAAPVPVFPGMEIRLDHNLCTLGYVDVGRRVAFTAGHCRASGLVTDAGGAVIGHLTNWRDNTPNGATVSTTDMISDYAGIALDPDVMLNDVLPGGRALVSDPGVGVAPGMRVCHFGVVTRETCGVVVAVNNGWFTMGDGVVSQKGDSGGPVYTITPDGRAVIVGLFNSTWGTYPTAVSWNSIGQQASEDMHTVIPAAAQAPA